MDFARVIHPVPWETFLAEHWERAPLLLKRGRPDYYAEVLRLEDVDDALLLGRPVSSDLLLVRQHDRLPLRDGVDVLEEVHRLQREGATLNLKRLERYWPGVADLCAALEDRFSHLAFAELFLTPQGTQGFQAHWDNTDGFILHLAGRKRWRLYHKPEHPPLRNRSFRPEELGPPVHDLVLEPGDFMYLPRGLVHEAVSEEGASLHIAAALVASTWKDLAAALLDHAAETDPRWRGALPPGFLDGTADLGSRLAELLATLRPDAEAALEAMRETAAQTRRPYPDGRFADLDRLPEIGAETRLRRRRAAVCRVRCEGDTVTIAFPGNTVQGPARLEPALRWVARQTEPFPVKDLPGDLSDGARQVLARTLVREGLLALA